MLTGWKAIAAYLKREERTAMRWANDRGLPVHRTPGPGRGSVYAIPAEIDLWLASARISLSEPAPPPAEPAPGPSPGRVRPSIVVIAALAAAMLLVLVLVITRPLSGSIVSPIARTGDAQVTDPGARAALLQASYDWNLRTRDSLQRAVHEFGTAIERDPRAVAAYVGLANSYLLLREDGALSDADAYPRADAAAHAALALAPESAAAHRALAFIAFWWHGDREAARSQFKQALASSPDDALTHHWYATALSANGEHAAALHEIEKARELDPAATAIVADEGLVKFLSGDRANGAAALRAIERDQPEVVAPHRALADILIWEGKVRDGLREQAVVAHLRGDASTSSAVEQLGKIPEMAITHAMLDEAQSAARQNRRDWFQVARLSALKGLAAQASDALNRSCKAREPQSIAAAGDLWLSRSLSLEQVRAICGGGSLQ